jgi:hypothetical protein
MIQPIPPETEFFCWFFFNGCCNSTVECGVPPFVYVVFLIAFLAVIFIIIRSLNRKGDRE